MSKDHIMTEITSKIAQYKASAMRIKGMQGELQALQTTVEAKLRQVSRRCLSTPMFH